MLDLSYRCSWFARMHRKIAHRLYHARIEKKRRIVAERPCWKMVERLACRSFYSERNWRDASDRYDWITIKSTRWNYWEIQVWRYYTMSIQYSTWQGCQGCASVSVLQTRKRERISRKESDERSARKNKRSERVSINSTHVKRTSSGVKLSSTFVQRWRNKNILVRCTQAYGSRIACNTCDSHAPLVCNCRGWLEQDN